MSLSLDAGTLPPSVPTPPYPKTERQAEFMALGDQLAEIAAAQASEHDRANTFPHDTFAALKDAGYLALTVPEEFGGKGARPLEVLLAQERLARGSGSVALGVTMHLVGVGNLADSRSWPDALMTPFFRDVVQNGAMINTAASEPDLGSPSRGGAFATRAKWTPEGWLINGRKSWTTLSPGLAYTVVQLTTEEQDGSLGRANILVPMTTPGVKVEFDSWDNMSMRSSGSNDVVYQDVLVPLANRLPGVPAVAGASVSGWSLISSAVYLGVGQAARDWAVQFAKERVPSGLGKPIAELQNVQFKIAQMDILLAQARALLYSTLETYEECPDQRAGLGWQFAAAKYAVTNNAVEVTDLALRVVGSAGLQRKYPLERYFRDARAGLGNPPIDDVALTIIGKRAVGL